MIVVYSLFIILYSAAILWRPRWALFLLFALLPSYQIRFRIFNLPTTLLEIMILTLLIVWLINKIKNQKSKIKITIQSLKLNSWATIISLWAIVSLLSVFISPDKWGAFGYWRAYFLEPILLLMIIFDLSGRDNGIKEIILCGLGVSALYCSVWAILQKFFGGGVLSTEIWGAPKIWRATGPFPQPNFLGLYLGPIILLAVGQLKFKIQNSKFKTTKQKLKVKESFEILFYFLTVLFSVWAVVLARSEGAILGVVAGLVFFGLLNQKSRRWTAAGMVILTLLIFFLPVTRNYLIPKITFQDLSGQLRLNIWRGTINLIKDHPILGVGLRGYQKLIPQYQKPYYLPTTGQLISVETHPHPHNLFLTIWAELGISGLIVFLWLLIKFFRTATKYEFGTNIRIYSLMSAMVVLIVHGLVDTPYFKNDLSILFWLIVGLTVILAKDWGFIKIQKCLVRWPSPVYGAALEKRLG